MKIFIKLSVLLILLTVYTFAGTTGKIAGQVIDAQTGEPLAGVNVIVENSALGASTDVDGFYVIINIKPGTYTLNISYIGYAEHAIQEVQVQLDLTTNVNAELRSELMTSEAVVVIAEKPVIQKDVAGSSKNIGSDEIEALPVSNIKQIIGLQAGISSTMEIRGSGSDQMLFVIDGISLKDSRTNQPISDIPMSAMEEVSVQSGGLGAEFSNVRSGVVNVVSKDGSGGYTGTITYKHRQASPKHFGTSPYDPNSFWMRPYTDDAVAWEGTKNGAWDEYKQRQYPTFIGWNKVSQSTLQNDDPSDDLTPEGAQRLFQWEHRKKGDIDKPDYDLDGGFGGPVPFISKYLGDLGFYFSFKNQKDMYLIQLATEAYETQSFMLRLSSSISPTLKLSLMGLKSNVTATSSSRTGLTGVFTTPWGVANSLERVGFTTPWRIYTDTYFNETERVSNIVSLKLTKVVNNHSFWDAKLTHVSRKYVTGPMRDRNTDLVNEIFEGYFVDEAPYGYYGEPVSSVEGRLTMGGAISVGRDTSNINVTTLSFDYVNQINRNNEVKTGGSFVYERYDMGFGMKNEFLPGGNTWSKIKQDPFRINVYIQDKLEFEGFVANVGLIVDYYNSNGKWYDVDNYSREFYSDSFNPDEKESFLTKDAESRFTLSPRLSISHPITETSKLFFNYGHYRQMPTSERFYRVQRDYANRMENVGDPYIELPRTVAYELGYDHALFDQYLLRIAAYYKDIEDQGKWVSYSSFDGKVNYDIITSNAYEDIRGFEVDISKRAGDWVTGNLNYEYRVNSNGFFGVDENYEDPAEQAKYERDNPVQNKPRPRPRIKSYVDFHTPRNFGPKLLDQNVLAGWHANFLSYWTTGSYFTWNPQNVDGVKYNVQWKDSYNFDLRISKVFRFENFDVKFFADISNLFNTKYFSNVSFEDKFDYEDYMKSLHLSEGVADDLLYGNIPGEDQPGDFRPTGVDFVPMEWRANLNNETNPNTRAIYYDASSKQYMQYTNGSWEEVGSNRLNQILDDKAYIDMPNQTYFTFLNPRNMFTGITLSYHF